MIEVKELMKTFVEQFKQCPSSGMIASPCTSSSSGSDITTPKRTGTKSIPLNIRVISFQLVSMIMIYHHLFCSKKQEGSMLL